MLRWLVPLSVAAHAAVFAIAPAHVAPLSPRVPRPPTVILAELPPPRPRVPPPEATAPVTHRANVPSPRAPSASIARAPSALDPSTGTSSDVPVDFTSTVMSNAAGSGPPSNSVQTATKEAPRPPEPSIVPPNALSRPPRAPGLDDELERNYPVDARRAGISGRAVLRLRILPDGRLGAVTRVSESREGFGVACERTVRAGHWQAPLDREGRPVATEITYTCRFETRS